MLDKPEWKLNGQQLTITLPITDPVSCNELSSQKYSLLKIQQVSVIKARIADELGMPTGKQKLQVGVSNVHLFHVTT